MSTGFKEAKTACAHEAGHIVAAITRGVPISRAAIAPLCDKGLAGVAQYAEVGDDFDMIVCALSGGIAEQRFTGRADEHGASGDRASIKRILAKRYGREVDSLNEPIVKAAEGEAEKIVATRWPEIEALAARLIEKFEIEAEEIREIVGRAATDRICKAIAELERFE